VGLFDTTQIGLDQALAGAAQRQQALANNIANANTPGYKRMDVDFHSALQKAFDSSDPSTAVSNVSFDTQTDTTTSTSADGNNVDMDTEMANLSENSLEYQSLVTVARSRLQMLQIAMGTR